MTHINYEGIANLRALMVAIHHGVESGTIKIGVEKPGLSFSMQSFARRSECGTAACAAGWAAIFNLVPNPGEVELLLFKEKGVYYNCVSWLWLFGTSWSVEPNHNTPMAFIQRLDALLPIFESELDGEDKRKAIHRLWDSLWDLTAIDEIPECLVGKQTMSFDLDEIPDKLATYNFE